MPQRIRTIKPELSRHEVLFEADLSTGLPLRFAFVMLLTCCDREGRFRWQPRVLKLDILPYDDCDFECVLNDLWRIGLIECYEHQAQLYGCIPTWRKHQRINLKEPASVLPPWTAEGAIAAQRRLKHQCLGGDIDKTVEVTPVFEVAPLSKQECNDYTGEQNEGFSAKEPLSASNTELLAQTDSNSDSFLNDCKPESVGASLVSSEREPSLRSDLAPLNATGFCREDSLEESLGSIEAHASTCQAQLGTCLGWAGKGREEEMEVESEREQERKGSGEGVEFFVAQNVRPDSRFEPVAKIFEYWKTVMQHPYAKLDPNRKKLIRKALKLGYSLEALCEAIRGCSQTPHNQGQNDRGQRYDGLHIILRNSDQIDRFIHNAKNPPRILNAADLRLQANIQNLQSVRSITRIRYL